MKPTRSHRVARGFTLVEVLVALLIMAILAVMSWQGVDGIVRTRDASKARLEATLRLNTVLAQWEQDLNAVQSSGSIVALTFDGASMRITRRAERGLQVVVWSLRPGLEGAQFGQSWVRWTGVPTVLTAELQNSWLTSQGLQGTEPNTVRALEGVAQWQVYCFRGAAWTNCQSSNDVTNSNAAVANVLIPSGVRLILTFADGSGQIGTLTRDVMLAPQWPSS